jgi:hypothetical protein
LQEQLHEKILDLSVRPRFCLHDLADAV